MSAAMTTAPTHLKPGTKIEICGSDGAWNEVWRPAVIRRWNEKLSGPRAKWPGWHIVRFDGDEGDLRCHERGIRVASCAS